MIFHFIIRFFLSGAMENCGLLTFRERCLLFDPEVSSTAVKQYVALIVAHEVAHQVGEVWRSPVWTVN